MIKLILLGFLIQLSSQGSIYDNFDCVIDGAQLVKQFKELIPLIRSENRNYTEILSEVKGIIETGKKASTDCNFTISSDKVDIGKCSDKLIKYAEFVTNLTDNFNAKLMPSLFTNLSTVVNNAISLYESCTGNLLTAAQIDCITYFRSQTEFVAKLTGTFNEGKMDTKELITRTFNALAKTPEALDNCGYISIGRSLRTATKNILNTDCMDDARRSVLSLQKIFNLYNEDRLKDAVQELFKAFLLSQHLNDHCMQDQEFLDEVKKEGTFLSLE